MTEAAGQPWRPVAGGIAVRVRLTPKASRDALEGVTSSADGPALKARVTAVPEKGAANAAVAALVAEWLGVAKSAVELTQGGKSRLKMLVIAGDSDELSHRIMARLGRVADKAGS